MLSISYIATLARGKHAAASLKSPVIMYISHALPERTIILLCNLLFFPLSLPSILPSRRELAAKGERGSWRVERLRANYYHRSSYKARGTPSLAFKLPIFRLSRLSPLRIVILTYAYIISRGCRSPRPRPCTREQLRSSVSYTLCVCTLCSSTVLCKRTRRVACLNRLENNSIGI